MNDYLTPKDLKERWHISTSTLKRIRRGGDLPCIDSGERQPGPGRHLVRFAREVVERWEQAHRAWLAKVQLLKMGKKTEDGHPSDEQPPEVKG